MSLIPRHSVFDLDHFFENQWSPFHALSAKGDNFTPRVDVTDTEQAIVVSAELPGINKDDIHVTVDKGVLTLEAESKQENREEQNGRVIRQERRYGKYSRSFQLGSHVQENDITASFQDGVLKLNIPKAGPEEPTTKRIAIQ